MKKRDLLYLAVIITLLLVCYSLWNETQRRGVVAVIDKDSMYVAPTASESTATGSFTVSVPKVGINVPKIGVSVPNLTENVLDLTESRDTVTANGTEEQVTVTDTGDSLKIDIPITQKVYRDSAYTAWVSGYRAKLDSISVRERTVILAAEPRGTKRPRITVGVTGGAGLVGLKGETGAGWFVGLGVTVPLWSW